MSTSGASQPTSRRSTPCFPRSSLASIALLALSLPSTLAQTNCISLSGSTTCPAFNQSSISTNADLRGLFPFLSSVTDLASFDTQFANYISNQYSQTKYQTLLGCSNVNLANTTDLYARYTSTVLCNAIVQNSAQTCGLTGNAARPVCAETCAEFAQSEENIASTPALCGTTNNNALNQIRADFTNCALPANSLNSGVCIHGYQNEPNNCGFANNLGSLCSYCAASSPNSTDSCCLFSNTETRCANVRLPITTAMGALFPSSTSSTVSSTASPTGAAGALSNNGMSAGLSGGAIAGIVIGSLLGALLLIGLLITFCLWTKRRRRSQAGSIFNQPSPTRQGPIPPASFTGSNRAVPEMLPAGARVHQMAALEDTASEAHSSPMAAYSSGYEDSPDSQRSGYGGGVAGVAGIIGKRDASNGSSPKSDEEPGSPQDISSGQSEQLSHFKDYYSNDDIHPGDRVSVLWAYNPRAADEWDLERGDMIKVVGIWDDGWATGYRISQRAENWDDVSRRANRDSGVSGGSRTRPTSLEQGSPDGEIKAFPLVCVCLPQHWRKTIEGDTMDPGASGTDGTDRDPNSSP